MKHWTFLFTFLMLSSLPNSVKAQSIFDLEQYSYDGDEPIHVEKLCTDSLSSGFLIWMKEGVKAHFHAKHTEYVMILEGSGEMEMDSVVHTVSPGQLIHIPQKTIHGVKVSSEAPLKVLSIQTPEFKGMDRIFVRPKKQ